MVKVRLWGENSEIEELLELIRNKLDGVRVLSVSGHYKDRGTSVYERCYIDVALTEQSAKQPTPKEQTANEPRKH